MTFLSLCYHYIRENKNSFPKILGTSKKIFEENITMLKKKYEMLDLNDVINLVHNKKISNYSKTGMLITFDDGLSDHYEAAKILTEQNINATFFIPTCIIEEKLPANPTIIHYCIAKYGILEFLKFFDLSLQKFNIIDNKLRIIFNKGKDDPWEIIKEIKNIFKYKLHHSISRKILIDIYNNSLLRDNSNVFEEMHLNEHKIKSMIKMGHSFGSHTHNHISVKPSYLSNSEKYDEFLKPKKILEDKFKISVDSFSYPFGEFADCLSHDKLHDYLKEYKLIFTVNEILNTKNTSKYELGRYQPISTDTTSILEDKLIQIENECEK